MDTLPAKTLWQTANFIKDTGIQIQPLEAELTPLEILGITIGILRRRKNFSRILFAQRVGCPVEELIALEMGLLPLQKILKYLPKISQGIDVPERSLQTFIRNLKFA